MESVDVQDVDVHVHVMLINNFNLWAVTLSGASNFLSTENGTVQLLGAKKHHVLKLKVSWRIYEWPYPSSPQVIQKAHPSSFHLAQMGRRPNACRHGCSRTIDLLNLHYTLGRIGRLQVHNCQAQPRGSVVFARLYADEYMYNLSDDVMTWIHEWAFSRRWNDD